MAPKNFVVVAEPVLSIEKRVEVAKAAVEEEIAKRFVFVSPESAKSDIFANGEVVPSPILPVFATVKSVALPAPAVDEPIVKRLRLREVEVACTENSEKVEVVPTPTMPRLFTVKSAFVVVEKPGAEVEAIAKSMLLVEVLLSMMVSCAQGVVVPRPTRPEKTLLPCTIRDGVVVPQVEVAAWPTVSVVRTASPSAEVKPASETERYGNSVSLATRKSGEENW